MASVPQLTLYDFYYGVSFVTDNNLIDPPAKDSREIELFPRV